MTMMERILVTMPSKMPSNRFLRQSLPWEDHCQTMAMPVLGTGIQGLDKCEMLDAILDATKKWVQRGAPMNRVMIVMYGTSDPALVQRFQTQSARFSDGLFDLLKESSSSPPTPKFDDKKHYQRALCNVQRNVTEYTGIWTDLETIYLVRQNDPAFAYRRLEEDHPLPPQVKKTTSICGNNVIYAHTLLRTTSSKQGSDTNPSFQEPRSPELVMMQVWSNESWKGDDAINSGLRQTIEILQDDSNMYVVSYPELHGPQNFQNMFQDEQENTTQRNQENNNSTHKEANTYITPNQKPTEDHSPEYPSQQQQEEESTAQFLVRTKEQTVEWLNNAYA